MVERSEFIEILSNFTFWIYFHEEKYPKGKIFWNEITGSWEFDVSKDYWNFYIQINSHHTDYVIENWKKNSYGEFLEKLLYEYLEHNSSANLSSLSKPDCFDLLSFEIEKLNFINKQFYIKTIGDEANPGRSYTVQWHHKICIENAVEDKGYIEDGDRFFNEQISFYVCRQKEVIESAISFLRKKIQWLEIKEGNDVNYENLKTQEHDFERIYKIHASLSTASKIKYFSFDRNESRLNDDNIDYMRSVLEENNIIEDVDYREFRHLFNNKVLLRPIVWIGGDPLLHYFIKTLVEREVIIEHNNVWKITSVWFVIKEKDTNSIRRIDPKRIARLKRPNKGVDFKKFDKVFSFIKP